MNGDQPKSQLQTKETYVMKFATIIAVIACAAALAACMGQGRDYASAGRPSPNLYLPSGYQTINDPHGYTCGPDWHVCHYENRDRLARGQQ